MEDSKFFNKCVELMYNKFRYTECMGYLNHLTTIKNVASNIEIPFVTIINDNLIVSPGMVYLEMYGYGRSLCLIQPDECIIKVCDQLIDKTYRIRRTGSYYL